jgi:Ca2+/H+ antiporter
MKKGSIVSLVFSCIFFVIGLAFIIASFRQALTPVNIQHFAEGFTMRLSINNLSLAISSLSLMFLVLGCSLFISAILLLILFSYLHVSSKDELNETVKNNKNEKRKLNNSQKVEAHQPNEPQTESVKVEEALVEPIVEDK